MYSHVHTNLGSFEQPVGESIGNENKERILTDSNWAKINSRKNILMKILFQENRGGPHWLQLGKDYFKKKYLDGDNLEIPNDADDHLCWYNCHLGSLSAVGAPEKISLLIF